MVVFGQRGCIREKLAVIWQSGFILAKVIVFALKCLNSDKSGCIQEKSLYSGKSGCIRENGFIRAKVVVFGKKSL